MMNLKYYLRGLGIGIIVTALIMGIVAGGKEKLSNAEIRERAKALGMVEEGTLLEAGGLSQAETDSAAENEPEEQKNEKHEPEAASKKDMDEEGTDESDQADTAEPGEIEEASPEPEAVPEEADEASEEPIETPKAVTTPDDMPEDSAALTESEPEETPEPEAENRPATGSVSLRIAQGDGSYSVCKRLEEAGLIESASEYDMFLYQNGYDKKIRAGSFEIPADAGGEKIARIITGME